MNETPVIRVYNDFLFFFLTGFQLFRMCKRSLPVVVSPVWMSFDYITGRDFSRPSQGVYLITLLQIYLLRIAEEMGGNMLDEDCFQSYLC